MTEKILFITANRVGDAVLATGLLSHLVKTRDATITLACGPVAADIFRAVPKIEKRLIIQKKPRHGHWVDLWKETHTTKWDLIVDLRNSLVSRLLPAKQRAYRPARSTGLHRVVDNAAALNLSPPPSPTLWLDDAAHSVALRLMPTGQPILALGPAANWPAKQWPCFNFIRLAHQLVGSGGPMAGAKVFIPAAAHERDQLVPLFRAFPQDQLILATNYDLLAIAACLKKCALFIGNDSGLMHLAAATGIKTLGLFGPSYPEVYGPFGPHTAFASTPETKDQLFARMDYPGEDYPNMMTGVEIGTVYEKAVALLKT